MGALVRMAGGTLRLRSKGSFKNIEKFLMKANKFTAMAVLSKYGRLGVDALAGNTPVLTGTTAGSWTYDIEGSQGNWKLVWRNTNVNKNVNIAIILQYGHGTRNGGYVVGRDYINPALRPIFDQFADELWEELTK